MAGSRVLPPVFTFVVCAILGGAVGGIAPLPKDDVRWVRAAWRLPKSADGAALRLAMVNDVVHERYLRHGRAWHEARIALRRPVVDAEAAAIAGGAAPSAAWLDAVDDLAVSLDRVGRPADAIAPLRSKATSLPRQSAEDAPAAKAASDPADDDLAEIAAIASARLDPIAHHRYTALANLGTMLLHDALPRLLAGDASARPAVEEGLAHLRAAMRINPAAHFGRETWQVVAGEHLLAVAAEPTIEARWTLIGDALDAVPPASGLRGFYATQRVGLPDHLTEPLGAPERAVAREAIARVGVDSAWSRLVHPSVVFPKPFDEPVLAILGMWTLGGGANPRFALALGVAMERIGQQRIAWTCYERAVELQAKWPEAHEVRATLVAFCRQRQDGIARAAAQRDGVAIDAWTTAQRRQHVDELAFGEGTQRAYDAFESERLAAGVALDAPDFDAPFLAAHGDLATVPGHEDDVPLRRERLLDRIAAMICGAGVFALLAGVDARWRVGRTGDAAGGRSRRRGGVERGVTVGVPRDAVDG